MAYDISSHPLLTPEAAALASDVFEEHAALAHDLLGLTGTSLTGEAAEKAKRFLVLQVNYQVESGVKAAVYIDVMRGRRREMYRRDLGLIRPGLLEEVTDLLGESEGSDGSWGDRGYSVITSFR